MKGKRNVKSQLRSIRMGEERKRQKKEPPKV